MENRQAPSGRKNSSHAVSLALRAGPVLLLVFFVDLDAQRLEKLQILIADLEFGVGAEVETREVLSVVCSPCLLTPMVASRTRKMS